MNDLVSPLVAPNFESVAELAQAQLTKAGGGALCVYLDGAPVLDVWAGKSDPTIDEPWTADTMAMSWSTTKGLASLAIHMLADRGMLSYDDPVSAHWPEFGVNGKETTTVGQVLSMQAGLYDIRHLIDDPRLMLDHDAMATALANAAPAHEPGVTSGYHAMTYGWLVGEIVQRVAGVSLGSFVRTEIAEPLQLDGCYIGTPAEQLGRVAARPKLRPLKPSVRLIGKALAPVGRLFGVRLTRIAAAFIPIDGHEVIGTDEFLQAEVAAANGVFTARSLARVYATLGSDDGLDDVQLWSPTTRHAAAERQTDRRDSVVPLKIGWQRGFHPPFPRKVTSPSSFGFYGAYGSGAFADPDRRLAVGLIVQEAKGMPMMKLVKPILAAADRSAGR